MPGMRRALKAYRLKVFLKKGVVSSSF